MNYSTVQESERIESSSDAQEVSSPPPSGHVTTRMSVALIAILVIVIAIGAKTMFAIQQHLIGREGERLSLLAKNIADRLYQNLFDRRGDIELLSKASVLLGDDVESMNAYLATVSETYQAFVGLSFLDADGMVLASSHPHVLNNDMSYLSSFHEAKHSKTLALDFVQADPVFEGQMVLTLSHPVLGPDQKLRGVVVGHVGVVSLRKLFEATIAPFIDETTGQNPYEWQLLSQQGTVLLENVLGQEGQVNLRELFVPSAWQVTSDRIGYVEEMHIRRHVPVLTGFAKMAAIPEVPGFHWGVLVRRDRSDVLEEVNALETKLGLAGLVMIGPLIGFVFLMIHRLEQSQHDTRQALSVAQANEEQMRTMARANQELANHNAMILESVGEGIYGLDSKGIATFVNPAAARMLGYRPEELIGQSMHAMIHHSKPDGAPYPVEACPMYAAFKEGSVRRVDHEVLWRRDGTSFPVDYTSTPIRDEEGALVGAVVTFRDITERKQAEEELLNAFSMTQGILDTAVDAIITIDELGKVESLNNAAQRMFGYRSEEVLGQNIKMLMPNPYRQAHDGYLARYRETGESHIIGSGREVIGLRKDGSIFPIELSVSEVQLKGRRIFTGIIRDITERREGERQLGMLYKRMEKNNKELEKARDDALQAVRLKSEFLAMISHEIRTPMNGVLGMTGILLESDLTTDQRECAETVKHSAEALLTILNDVLDFSKIESGKLDIEVIDFDLRVAVEEVLDLVGAKAHEKGIELVGLIYASVPTDVRGDPGRFRQILLNLVGNAIKFTEKGEVVVQVTPETETDQHVMVKVDVMDTGVGIAPEAQKRLFQPFTQADGSTTRKYGGTGLGLSICKKLAELMQGSIGVESMPGHGSRFWFTVRLEKQQQPKTVQTPASRSLKGLRVCLVEDNDTNRFLLHHYAVEWGMECLSADNAAAAMALLKDAADRHNPCDLLIVNQHMAGTDGIELARRVKADPALAAVKIILMTSMGKRGDAAAAREAGIAAYLTKPIHQDQLRDCLWMVMNGTEESQSQLITKYTIQEAKKKVDTRLLVADDNVVNQKVAVRMLEKLGYRVDVVANGLEAVEAVSRIPYDLVFMDCQMPEMDGYNATREIRKREAEEREGSQGSLSTLHASRDTLHIPIIAMTANTMKGDREKCLEAGMDDFVPKPVKNEELERVLSRWLPRKVDDFRDVESSSPDTNRHGQTLTKEEDPMNEEPKAPPLDAQTLQELKDLGDGDPSFLVEVIQQFLHDAPGHLEAILQAAADGNADALMKAAHGFKGSCRNMGAFPLGEVCFALEQQGRDGDATNVDALLVSLREEHARAMHALEAQLSELSVQSGS